MSEITLTVKGYQFSHPKENISASQLIQNAASRSDYRLKAAANLFFATLFNLGNTAYYTTSTVLGTVKRFPTEGKKEAKNFLNAEGLKALNTAIYAATTALLTIASLYDSKWALSHIDVKCPPQREPEQEEVVIDQEEGQRKMQGALLLSDETFQVSFATIMQLLDIEQKNESNTLISPINYFAIFIKRYQADFADPENIDNNLQGMKKVLAAIAFMRDTTDNVHHFQTEYDAAQIELFELKQAYNLQKEEARAENQMKSAVDAPLIGEQDVDFEEALEIDRREAQERREAEAIALEKRIQKGVQEEALGVVEAELGQVLEGLGTRLESFVGIRDDLLHNWRQTETKTGGRYAMDAQTIFRFVSARVKDVDLGRIDLAKVPERAALDGLQEKYPLADDTFFERINAAQKTIQERTVEINTLIDYAGLTTLKNAFPEGAEDVQKAEHGQYILNHIAAFRQ